MSVVRSVSRTTVRSPMPTWDSAWSASSPSAGDTRTSWRRRTPMKSLTIRSSG